jgi:hypothetical protein
MIAIEVNDAGLLPEIERRLPFGAVRCESATADRTCSVVVSPIAGDLAARHVLYVDQRRRGSSDSLKQLLRMLRRDLQLSVARLARDYLFVHAGVVVWRDRAVLLPGHSFSGKSTLVAALLEAGAGYLSDEYALLDLNGRVHAYPRPLALRDGSRRRRHVSVAVNHGAHPTPAAVPVGAVVVTRFRSGYRWQPRAAGAGEGILGLLAHTVVARDRPVAAFRVLKRAVSDATVLIGVRGEAAETAQMLLKRFPAKEGTS